MEAGPAVRWGAAGKAWAEACEAAPTAIRSIQAILFHMLRSIRSPLLATATE
jgi:hypothetical protein